LIDAEAVGCCPRRSAPGAVVAPGELTGALTAPILALEATNGITYAYRRFGTGPRGGRQMHGWIVYIERTADAANNGVEDLLRIFFEATETSRALGREYVRRAFSRTEDGDNPNGPEAAQAQYDAVVEWGIPDPTQLNRLAGITQPTLVANGDNDLMIPTVNSHLLADHLPNARLRIYPDAAHGFLFQYPRQFGDLVTEFLSAP
jgi:pimeloyl-ACP methyl ester carboxylesterase